MIELGQLEASHEEMKKRNARVVVASLEDQKTAQATQAEFPHLEVISDADRHLANVLQLIHPHSAMDGGDTTTPTTFLIDSTGTVRWIYRSERVMIRLSPADLAKALDEKMPK